MKYIIGAFIVLIVFFSVDALSYTCWNEDVGSTTISYNYFPSDRSRVPMNYREPETRWPPLNIIKCTSVFEDDKADEVQVIYYGIERPIIYTVPEDRYYYISSVIRTEDDIRELQKATREEPEYSHKNIRAKLKGSPSDVPEYYYKLEKRSYCIDSIRC